MIISTEQKAILRRICKIQEESLIRIISEDDVDLLFNELQEEGYEVTKTEILEKITKELKIWEDIRDNPERFNEFVDAMTLSLLKHHLFNEFDYHNHEVKGIFKKLFIIDQIYESLN